jgi:TonB-like protein
MHMRTASSVVSLTVHVVVVVTAVWATTKAHSAVPSTPVTYVPLPPATRATHGSASGIPAPIIDGGVKVPPIALSPIDAGLPRVTFDPRQDLGPLLAGTPQGDGMPMESSLVEELPVRLVGPSAGYPDLLRQAGVQGRVVLEAVIDTLGHVEPGSVLVVESAHPAFVAPAQHSLLGSLFRPARVQGRAARVRVRLAFDFVLRDGRL